VLVIFSSEGNPFPITFAADSRFPIVAAERLDEYKKIPVDENTEIYVVTGAGLEIEGPAAIVQMPSGSPQSTLYLFVHAEESSDNGYILIHEDDVDDWIAYYGRTNNSAYISAVKNSLSKFTVMNESFETNTYYNHAVVAQTAGGSPGQFNFIPGPGYYTLSVTNTKRYEDTYTHSISMDVSASATVGEPVTITLTSNEGSHFIVRHQTWDLTISGPGGTVKPLNKAPQYLGGRTHTQTLSHTFNQPGTYTLTFEMEDASYHNDERTGTNRYSVTKTITVSSAIDPKVTTTAAANPDLVEYTGISVPVTITANADLTGYNNAANVKEWVFYARKKGQASTQTSKTLPGGSLTQSTTFSFTIPASDVTGDTFTQDFEVWAVAVYHNPVTTVHGTTVTSTQGNPVTTSTTIYKTAPPAGNPIAEFSWSPLSPLAGREVKFTDESAHPDNVEIVQWRWSINGKTFTEQNPTYSFPEEGEYDATLEVTDANGKKDSVTHTIIVAEENEPPQACINAPDEVMAGEQFTVRSCSSDPDGTIVKLWWDWEGQDNPNIVVGGIDNDHNSGRLTYLRTGEYDIGLVVADDRGEQDAASRTVRVIPPVPQAKITFSGTRKVNRKITLDGSGSRGNDYFPLNPAKTRWTITPADSSASTDIRYHGSLVGEQAKDVLFKNPGTYRVQLYVENTAGNSATAELNLVIQPDLPPIADFTTVNTVLRDPNDGNQASIVLTDNSASLDGDPIASRKWEYRFDSDNDGSFTDESWVLLSSGNETTVTLKRTHVGKYQFQLTVNEAADEDIWWDFVTPAEIPMDTTGDKPLSESVVEVVNVAPTLQVQMTPKTPKAQVILAMGDTAHSHSTIQSKFNSLVTTKLLSAGIDVQVHAFSTPKGWETKPLAWTSGKVAEIVGMNDQYVFYKKPSSSSNVYMARKSDGAGETFIFDRGSNASRIKFSQTYLHYVTTGTSGSGSTSSFIHRKPWNTGPNDGLQQNWYSFVGDYAVEYDVGLYSDRLIYRYPTVGSLNLANNSGNRLNGVNSLTDFYLTEDGTKVVFRENNSLNIYIAPYELNTYTNTAIRAFRIEGITKGGWVYFRYYDSQADLYKFQINTPSQRTFVGTIPTSSTLYVGDNEVFEIARSYNSGVYTFSFYKIANTQRELIHQIQTNSSSIHTFFDGSNLYYVENNTVYVFKYSQSVKLLNAMSSVTKQSGAEVIVVPVEDTLLSELSDSQLRSNVIQALLAKDAYYTPLGTSANQSQHNGVISSIGGKGQFFHNSDLDTAMNNLADYLLASLKKPPNNTVYITLDQAVDYAAQYQDRENDPEYAQYWKFYHDPYVFENPMGLSAYHNTERTTPVTTFDKKGLYVVDHRRRDNPVGTDNRFDNYRLWSNPLEDFKIYVHERPVANFTTKLVFDAANNRYNLTLDAGSSYDPDTASRADRGIQAYRWMWKTRNGAWNISAPPATIPLGEEYTIQLMVQDIHGAWSVPFERVVSADPAFLSPSAGFTINPNPGYINQTIAFTSTASHPRAGEPLTYRYYLKPPGGTETQVSTTANWTRTFNTRTSYQIRQVVTDSSGNSDEFIGNLQIINRVPTAQVTQPAAASASSPTVFATATPTIIWTFSDPDNDAQQRYQLVIHRQSDGAVVFDSGDTVSSVKQQTVSGLAENVTYQAAVRVYDCCEWSAWSSPKYFKLQLNRPPVAAFTWTPNPVWEGDAVQLTNTSADPDGDPLTAEWRLRWPDGTESTYSSQHVARIFGQPGIVQVTLTVSDGKLSNSVTRSIQVQPLTLEPAVWHTDRWRDYHLERGHETVNDPKDFYAGELFRLQAGTSPAPVTRVTAWLDACSRLGSKLYTTAELAAALPNVYTGELYDERWISATDGLPTGTYAIRFRAEYANGTVKEADVPIRIIGNALSTAGVHRLR
jgi:PKD repeat protein